jgi:hypothetical protein
MSQPRSALKSLRGSLPRSALLLLVLLSVARAADAADASATSSAQAPTLVLIMSEPSGASLTIDGKPEGKTSASLGQLTPGAHHLVASLEDHQTIEQEIVVKEHETNIVKLTLVHLQGTLRMTTTEPMFCTIGAFKLKIEIGDVPLLRVPVGPVAIHCESDFSLPINMEIRVRVDDESRVDLAPKRVASRMRIRVDGPESRHWELRSPAGTTLCRSLPCTVAWAGSGMTIEGTSDRGLDPPVTAQLPDEMPFLPAPGVAVHAVWNAQRGSLTKSIVGLSVSTLFLGGAVPLCIIQAKSDSGTNVGAGVGCVALSVLGGVGAIMSSIGLATWSPGHWSFTAIPDNEKSSTERDEKVRWSLGLTGNSASARVTF